MEEGIKLLDFATTDQILQVHDIPYTLNGKRVEVPVKKASPKYAMNSCWTLLLIACFSRTFNSRKRRVFLLLISFSDH